MSGRFLLDTNAVISLLTGDKSLAQLISSASWIGISIISYIEFLSFSKLSTGDEELFKIFCQRVEVCSLSIENERLLGEIISFRRSSKVKLPDAIICMTAKEKDAMLITKDVQLLNSSFVSTRGW